MADTTADVDVLGRVTAVRNAAVGQREDLRTALACLADAADGMLAAYSDPDVPDTDGLAVPAQILAGAARLAREALHELPPAVAG